jgi:hypothetical protein
MNKVLRAILQTAAYTLFCAAVYFFSTMPAYNYLNSDQAEIKLAFKHASQRVEPCIKRSRKELLKLPPNMRKANDCPRMRAIVQVRITLDNQVIATEDFIPPGLHQDATVFAYAKLPLPVGNRRLLVEMRDTARTEGYDYSKEEYLDITTGQALVIGFDELKHELTFSH